MTNDSTSKVLYSIQTAIILPTNLVGNTLVCLVVITTPQLRIPLNFLLVNLAVADVLVALFTSTDLLFRYGVAHVGGEIGDYLCKFLTGKLLAWVGSVASVFSLVAVAFERYYAIVHPLRTRGTVSRNALAWTLTVCWLVAFLFNIPLILVRAYNSNNKETGYVCISNWPNTNLAIAYNFVWLAFIGVIPTVILIILYVKIVRKLWQPSTVLTTESTARLKSKKKVTKMLIFLAVLYVLCWMPNLLVNVFMYYYTSTSLESIGYAVTEILVLINSTINPFVYAIQSQQFYNGIKKFLCCGRAPRIHARQPHPIANNRNVTTSSL